MTTRAALAALAAGALGVVGQAPAEPLRPLPGSMPRALAGMAAGAPAPAELPLEHVTVLLGLRARAALDAVLAAQQDSRSPCFWRWLEPEEIADRFGPSRGEYARVRRWFETHGFRVVHGRRRSALRSASFATATAASTMAPRPLPRSPWRSPGRCTASSVSMISPTSSRWRGSRATGWRSGRATWRSCTARHRCRRGVSPAPGARSRWPRAATSPTPT
ncbi:MAG: hypothetical protein E6J75_11260 [Deltaproteobacteria bacterium]|nr:MAG: hypothetical protein E6J75_11260 [Deltaproteobacteria bacterium]